MSISATPVSFLLKQQITLQKSTMKHYM